MLQAGTGSDEGHVLRRGLGTEKDSLCLTYEGEEQKICWRLQVKGDRFRMTTNSAVLARADTSGKPDNL